ncbi:MAG: isoamylase early set domain-containing protein [Verrucomicrobiota bacterium]
MKPSPLKKETFSIDTPVAASVLLAADFTSWEASAIPLKRRGKGIWEASVKLAPGTYHYRFIVDGQWTDDPACTLRAPNGFGSHNAIRTVA